MGRMKETIPDKYVCSKYCEEICMECQYSMETAHLNERFKPSIEKWYNNKVFGNKIKDYFKKNKKKGTK